MQAIRTTLASFKKAKYLTKEREKTEGTSPGKFAESRQTFFFSHLRI